MSSSFADRLIIIAWAEIGKERMSLALPDLNALNGPGMLGNQWPERSTLQQMHEFICSQQAYALVDGASGRILGGYGLRQDEHAACWFYYYVFAPWRGQGLSAVLLAHIELSAFKNKKCMTIRAHCAQTNKASIRALRKAGMVSITNADSSRSGLLFIKPRPTQPRVQLPGAPAP